MKNFKYVLLFPFLLFIFSLIGCELQNPVDGVDLIVDTDDLVKTVAAFEIENAKEGGVLPTNVQVTLSGADADKVLDMTGGREYLVTPEGFITLLLKPGVAPTEASPINFNILVNAEGFLPYEQSVSLTQEGSFAAKIRMINLAAPPAGMIAGKVSGVTAANGALLAPISLNAATGNDPDQHSGVELELEAGTQFLDDNGNPISGEFDLEYLFDEAQDNTLFEDEEALTKGTNILSFGFRRSWSFFRVKFRFGSSWRYSYRTSRPFLVRYSVSTSRFPGIQNPTTTLGIGFRGGVLTTTVVLVGNRYVIQSYASRFRAYSLYWYTNYRFDRTFTVQSNISADLLANYNVRTGGELFFYQIIDDNTGAVVGSGYTSLYNGSTFRFNRIVSLGFRPRLIIRKDFPTSPSDFVFNGALSGNTVSVTLGNGVGFNLVGNCANNSRILIRPTATIYYRPNGSTVGFKMLGTITAGRLFTTKLEQGKAYEFMATFNGESVKGSGTITRTDYTESRTLPVKYCGGF